MLSAAGRLMVAEEQFAMSLVLRERFGGRCCRYCSACRDKLWTWAGKGFNWLRVTLVYFWALCGVAIVLLGALIGHGQSPPLLSEQQFQLEFGRDL
eukprot:4062049-Amphidinium_carterae.1